VSFGMIIRENTLKPTEKSTSLTLGWRPPMDSCEVPPTGLSIGEQIGDRQLHRL
jgi:hypothetical protein